MLALTGLLAGASGLFGGVKRWFNAEALKALSMSIIFVVILSGGWLLFRAGGTGAVAKRDVTWLTGLAKISAARTKLADAQRQAADSAAAAERDKALADLKAQTERAGDLERQLATYKDNPVAFPRDLARSISR